MMHNYYVVLTAMHTCCVVLIGMQKCCGVLVGMGIWCVMWCTAQTHCGLSCCGANVLCWVEMLCCVEWDAESVHGVVS